MNKGNDTQRQRLIKLIHVARRDLGMAEDSYRDIVRKITKARSNSIKDCTVLELERVMSHLRKAGFKVRKPKTAQPKETRQLATGGGVSKVRALWLMLHELGAVQNPSEAALNAYVKRITCVEDLGWLSADRLFIVIETLKKWAVRVFPACIETLMAQCKAKGFLDAGADRASVTAYFAPHLSPNTYDALLAVHNGLNGYLLMQRNKVST